MTLAAGYRHPRGCCDAQGALRERFLIRTREHPPIVLWMLGQHPACKRESRSLSMLSALCGAVRGAAEPHGAAAERDPVAPQRVDHGGRLRLHGQHRRELRPASRRLLGARPDAGTSPVSVSRGQERPHNVCPDCNFAVLCRPYALGGDPLLRQSLSVAGPATRLAGRSCPWLCWPCMHETVIADD